MNKLTFAIAVCLALFIVWYPQWPPLTDLPQHAAQIGWMLRFEQIDVPHIDLFWLNLVTPYLFGYGLAYVFAHFMSISAALKLVLTLYVLGFLYTTDRLLQTVRYRREWLLLFVPAALGYPYQAGFLNYLIGTPLLLFVTFYTVQLIQEPKRVHGFILSVVLVLLIPVHALISLLAGAFGGVMALSYPRPWRERIPLAAVFTTPLPGLFLWGYLTSDELAVGPTTLWLTDLSARPINLIRNVINADGGLGAVVAGIFLFTAPFLLGARPSARLWRWTPFLGLLILNLFLPDRLLATCYIWERLAPLSFLFWVFALDPRTPPTQARWSTVIYAFVPLLVLGQQAVRVARYDASLGDFRRALAALPPDERVLMLITDQEGMGPGFAYQHLPAWYSAEQGGVMDHSFASLYPQIIRYLPEVDPFIRVEQWFTIDERDTSPWAYFIVRAKYDPQQEVFQSDTPPKLVHHSGKWWVYQR